MQPKHHKYSPSSLARLEKCPASIAGHDLPEITNEYAEEGTKLHEWVAKTLKGEFIADEMTEEQQELVQSCVDIVEADDFWIEQKLELAGLTEGTLDVVELYDDFVRVIDWKFGRNQVDDAENNMQLAAYAAMAMERYERDAAVVVVWQPRIRKYTEATYHNPFDIIKRIGDIINACEAPDAPYNVGEQCAYCPLKLHGKCPELNGDALAIVNSSITQKIDLLAPEQQVMLLERAKQVESLIEILKDRIIKGCKEFGNYGGMTLKTQRGNRILTDTKEAYQRLAEWLNDDEFIDACNVSLVKLENLFASKQDMPKSDAKKKFAEVLGDIIGYGKDKEILVKAKESEHAKLELAKS